MSTLTVKSENGKFTCIECKNENAIPADLEVGTVVECEFCGLEYRVVSVAEDGNYTLEVLEEEK